MKWLTDNLAVLNVVLIVFSIIVYLVILDWISFMTSTWPVGGMIDYRWFGLIIVFKVWQGNWVPSTAFPDFASYLLVELVLLNGIAFAVFFFKTPADEDPRTTHARKLAVRNLALAVVCFAVFVSTMSFIDASLKYWSTQYETGANVGYYFPFGIIIAPVVSPGRAGHGLDNVVSFDFTLLLLLLLLWSTIATIGQQIRYQPPAKPPTETQM